MAKKTKDLEENKIEVKKVTKKSTTIKKEADKPKAAEKKNTLKKETAKKTDTVKKADSKKETTKKTSSVKKDSLKKETTKKSSTTKKTTSKKVAAKKTSTKKASSKKEAEIKYLSEYYDLPYSYNKTMVKLLAQTPKTLFVYWELSEDHCNYLRDTYGQNFFDITKPVLIVYNDTMNYSFEIDINDFANSWYIHINDSYCDYRVELGRRPLPSANQNIQSVEEKNNNAQIAYIPFYVFLTSSNEMPAPNDKMLFNPNQTTITFKNIKTGEIKEKDIKEFHFITNFGIFSTKDLYKYLFPNESFEFENFLSGDHSSGIPTSGSFSSWSK